MSVINDNKFEAAFRSYRGHCCFDRRNRGQGYSAVWGAAHISLLYQGPFSAVQLPRGFCLEQTTLIHANIVLTIFKEGKEGEDMTKEF